MRVGKSAAVWYVEVAAVEGVDLAERAAEPVNRYSIARGVIRLSAHIARRFR